MEQRKSTLDSENLSSREQPPVSLQQYKVGHVPDTQDCEEALEGNRQKSLAELGLCVFPRHDGCYIFLLGLGTLLEGAAVVEPVQYLNCDRVT